MKLLRHAEDIACASGLIFCTFATIFQILNRYWLHIEIVWIGEFLLYVFTLTVILSIDITTREDAHTNVDILMGALSSRNKKAGQILKFILNLLSFCAVCSLLPLFYRYALKAYRYPEWGSLCSWFNASWLIEALFLMFLLSALHIAANCWRAARAVRGGERADSR